MKRALAFGVALSLLMVPLIVSAARGDVSLTRDPKTGYLTGQVPSGEKTYTVYVLDQSRDGRYDGFFNTAAPRRFDAFACDLDGNGAVSQEEVLPLSKIVEVRGAYFSVEASADGKSLVLKDAKPALGTLTATSPDVTLLVASKDCYLRLSGSDGKWQVPAGTYTVTAVTLKKTDEKGATWTLAAARLPEDKFRNIEVKAGGTTELKAGAPLMTRAQVTEGPGVVAFTPALVGQSGEVYATPAAARNNQRQAAPKFRIVNRAGKVLASGAFQYG